MNLLNIRVVRADGYVFELPLDEVGPERHFDAEQQYRIRSLQEGEAYQCEDFTATRLT